MTLRLNFYKWNKTPYNKNLKRDGLSAYVHMKRDAALPMYASVNILDGPLHFPSYVHT